ncbi:MAG: hypothetical protein H6705_15325 [Myxococcales bacterium]|nr:hypothetical protein [Myxococcales bacterium]
MRPSAPAGSVSSTARRRGAGVMPSAARGHRRSPGRRAARRCHRRARRRRQAASRASASARALARRPASLGGLGVAALGVAALGARAGLGLLGVAALGGLARRGGVGFAALGGAALGGAAFVMAAGRVALGDVIAAVDGIRAIGAAPLPRRRALDRRAEEGLEVGAGGAPGLSRADRGLTGARGAGGDRHVHVTSSAGRP